MELNKIIYLLAGVIIVLLIECFAVSTMTFAKHDTSINVVSNNTLCDGDNFSITLADVNGTPLANQVVNITIIDAKGEENHQQVTTDESGNAVLQLNGLNPGEYTFNVTFGGNNDYGGCNVAKKVTMEKKVVEAQLTSSSSNGQSSSHSDWVDSDGRNHFYENGQEYVGSREGQHMTVEQAQYVAEHGMV